jgi:hypothetical protein
MVAPMTDSSPRPRTTRTRIVAIASRSEVDSFARVGSQDGHLCLDPGETEKVSRLICALHADLSNPGVGHALKVGALLDLILLELAGQLGLDEHRADGSPDVPPQVAKVLARLLLDMQPSGCISSSM